jgi:hypothetical protein
MDWLTNLFVLAEHHNVLALIILLFLIVAVGGGFALAAGVKSKRPPRSKQEAVSKHVDDLFKEAYRLAKKLGRGSIGYRVMSGCLAAIEVLGGAYFAVAGTSTPR